MTRKQTDSQPLAHNTKRSGRPAVIVEPRWYYFAEGERDREWHPASDAEYQAYLDYWNRETDEGRN